LFGKEHPYGHDTDLPLFIRGPGVPANTTLLHPTTHIDITATVVELAGAAPAGPPLDGKSFARELSAPGPAAAWRDFSFTEFFENANTWQTLRRPLDDPPTRYTLWCAAGGQEVFDLAADPFEMDNLDGTPGGAAAAAAGYPLVYALGACKGAECSAPAAGKPPKKNALACHPTSKGAEGWW